MSASSKSVRKVTPVFENMDEFGLGYSNRQDAGHIQAKGSSSGGGCCCCCCCCCCGGATDIEE